MSLLNQLTLITDEISQDFNHVLDIAQGFGIKDVELRTIWGKNIVLFTDEELEKLKKALTIRNMGVSMISGPFGKCVLPGSKFAKNTKPNFSRNPDYNLQLFDRILEISDILETSNIRIFNFFKMGSKQNDENWNLMIDTLRPYVEIASKKGKVLLVENEHVTFLDTIKNTSRFFKDMDNPSIKLNLDPGNYFSGKEPTTPEAYEQFYKKNLVGYMHVKDPRFRIPFVGGIFGVVGEGKIDYSGLFKQAIQHGYKGYISLETHSLKNKEPTSVKSLHNMVDMIKNIE